MKELAIIMCAICLLVFLADGTWTKYDLKREAVKLGYAEYNPTNGNWQWRTNR